MPKTEFDESFVLLKVRSRFNLQRPDLGAGAAGALPQMFRFLLTKVDGIGGIGQFMNREGQDFTRDSTCQQQGQHEDTI